MNGCGFQRKLPFWLSLLDFLNLIYVYNNLFYIYYLSTEAAKLQNYTFIRGRVGLSSQNCTQVRVLLLLKNMTQVK